jgi:hypothetical protein
MNQFGMKMPFLMLPRKISKQFNSKLEKINVILHRFLRNLSRLMKLKMTLLLSKRTFRMRLMPSQPRTQLVVTKLRSLLKESRGKNKMSWIRLHLVNSNLIPVTSSSDSSTLLVESHYCSQ